MTTTTTTTTTKCGKKIREEKKKSFNVSYLRYVELGFGSVSSLSQRVDGRIGGL